MNRLKVVLLLVNMSLLVAGSGYGQSIYVERLRNRFSVDLDSLRLYLAQAGALEDLMLSSPDSTLRILTVDTARYRSSIIKRDLKANPTPDSTDRDDNTERDYEYHEIATATNEGIQKYLTRVLTNSTSNDYNLDTLLQRSLLSILHSDDERVWCFGWSDNHQGSGHYWESLLYYKPKRGAGRVYPSPLTGLADQVYHLRSKTKNIYLFFETRMDCPVCEYLGCHAVAITPNGFDEAYPAFEDTPGLAPEKVTRKGYSSSIIINSMQGDIVAFDLDEKSQVLTIEYLTDDRTPITTTDQQKQRRIRRKLRFDGVHFVRDARR